SSASAPRSPPPTRRKNEFRARSTVAHQGRQRRPLHEAGAGKRAARAQGARLQAVRRAGRSARPHAGHAVRGLRRRAGVRSPSADGAFQEIPRRGGAAARLAAAPRLAPSRLRHREQLHELGGRHPALDVDHVALHLGKDRAHAAERKQRQHREVQTQLEENQSSSPLDKSIPTAAATGTTMSSDTRPIATARKQAAIIATAAGRLASGRPSFTAVAMNSPAPAAPTPVTAAWIIGLEAKSAYSSARPRTQTYGSANRPR